MVSAAIRRRKMDAAAAPTGDFWAVVCHGRIRHDKKGRPSLDTKNLDKITYVDTLNTP